MYVRRSLMWAGAVMMLTLTAGLSGCQSQQMDSSKSLYTRLGGHDAVAAVVDDFVNRAAGDPAVNFTRKGTPAYWDPTPEHVAMLKKHLTAFIAQATGGPQMYHGKDMASAHKDMQITNAQFNALAADLKASLDKFNVPDKEQNELLAIVETTRSSIVTK